MLIFFYLSAILAYSQSYILYLITFKIHSKLTKVKKPPAWSRTLNLRRNIKFTNRVLKLRTLALVRQCLTMLKSKAICNSDRTTILYNYFKSVSSGKSRNRAISKKPLIFWAIFGLHYKTKNL